MMGPLYWEWIKQYTATDQLLAGLFLFGATMMVGYYMTLLLPWDKKIIRWLQNLQAAVILGIIAITIIAPRLVELGVITAE